MNEKLIPVIKFPTKILLVDDNQSFLENFSHKLQSKFLVKTFNNAKKAIQYLQDHSDTSIESIYNIESSIDQDINLEYPLIDFQKILDIVYSKERFNNVALVFIDYSMPNQMTGIQFCEEIKENPVRKIMLTGEADNNLAVAAFNDKKIDRFILKDADGVIDEIFAAIDEEQQEYFCQLSNQIPSWKTYNKKIAKNFNSVFNDFIHKHDIVEYYQIGFSSYLLLDERATPYWFVFQSPIEKQQNITLATDNHAPKQIIDMLQNNENMLFLFSEKERKLSVDKWENYIFPAMGWIDDCSYTCIGNEIFSLDVDRLVSYKTILALE